MKSKSVAYAETLLDFRSIYISRYINGYFFQTVKKKESNNSMSFNIYIKVYILFFPFFFCTSGRNEPGTGSMLQRSQSSWLSVSRVEVCTPLPRATLPPAHTHICQFPRFTGCHTDLWSCPCPWQVKRIYLRRKSQAASNGRPVSAPQHINTGKKKNMNAILYTVHTIIPDIVCEYVISAGLYTV